MMTQQNDKKPPVPRSSMRPGLRILLFGSLALNLLVIGVVSGTVFSNARLGPPRADGFVGPILQALNPADRRAIGLAMRREHRRAQPQQKSIIEDFQPIITALRAQTFDQDRLARALSQQQEMIKERMSFGQRLLVARLVNMSAQERNDFADRLIGELENGPPLGRRPLPRK